jgi:radical SAM protein with 4Fe4S-binding SPASM domain
MKFRKTYIEITNICNLSCPFCPKTTREPRFMEKELFREILYQLRGLSKRLYFHVVGEPLLHPAVGEFIDECSLLGYTVVLVTNGTMLARTAAGLLSKPALRQVSVSLQSCGKNWDEKELREYFHAIKSFVARAAYSSGPIVQLRLWNKGAVDPDFRSLLLRLIKEIFELSLFPEHRLKNHRAIVLSKNLCIDSAAPFEWPSLEKKNIGDKGTCYGLRKQFAILVDGTITPCCLDNNGSVNLGNIRELRLSEILSSPRANAIRKGFEKGEVVEELCRKCSYRTRFSPTANAQTLP